MKMPKEFRNLDKEFKKLERKMDLIMKPRTFRAVIAHPDLCIYLNRDFPRIGGRRMVKKGEKRGFFVMSFLWLSASIRW